MSRSPKIPSAVTVNGSLQASASVTSVIRVRVRLLRWREIPAEEDNDYQALIIKEGDRFFYRARGTTVPISGDEAEMVLKNPFMYYFSTALKLHIRIERALERRRQTRSLGERGLSL